MVHVVGSRLVVRSPRRAGALVLVLLAGCGAGSQDTATTGETSEAPTTIDRQAEVEDGLAAVDRLHTCMEELGFTVREEPGSVSIQPMPGDEGDVMFHESMEECREQADFPVHVPASDTELAGLYELQLERMECLEANGYTPEPAPSLEVFVEGHRQAAAGGAAPPWDPLDHQNAGGRLFELLELCPRPQLADL